jgi:hypothetical protein
MNLSQLLVAVGLAIASGAPIAGFLGGANVAQPIPSTEVRIPLFHGFPTEFAGQSELASLEPTSGWNSPPPTPLDLRGTVVVVDFWTYTCINWRRTLAYTRAWYEKYRNYGLVMIGIHAPDGGGAYEGVFDVSKKATWRGATGAALVARGRTVRDTS